jgi:hypothetical protein
MQFPFLINGNHVEARGRLSVVMEIDPAVNMRLTMG